ncbi:Fph type histidine kinase [Suillus bovinus]|uniref:Fph type histidine kinase n=1 Tax=Suillus bovinus TaxID=48563 RepID=UPI001B86EE09|nr:Fph type histidine kinase [Suillus bovinus]KAG2157960.1 Fph type histidine kinase [Suillus bovinus]
MQGLQGRNYSSSSSISKLTLCTQSSDQSSSETAEEDSDDEPRDVRGRRPSQKGLRRDVRDAIRRKRHATSPSQQRSGPIPLDYSNNGKQIGSLPRRMSFTRSRSPHPRTFDNATNAAHSPSGASSFPQRHKLLPVVHTLLPAMISGSLSLPWLGTWTFCMDTRYMGESLLLIGSLACFNKKLSDDTHDIIDSSMSTEMYVLIIIAMFYIIRAHTILPQFNATAPTAPESRRATSPRTETREIRRSGSQLSPTIKPRFSFIWMSVPKNYRHVRFLSVRLLLPPMIALALLYSALRQVHSPSSDPNLPPPHWLIEAPSVLHNPRSPDSAIDALIQSRRGLVDYSTMCSFILLAQVCSSWIIETRYRGRPSVPEGERGSVPRSEMRRTWLYVLFTFGMTMLAITVRYLFALAEIPIWRNISYLDIGIGSLFYQLCLYSALRLAHGGFTLGELALVCFGGLSLATELLGLTRARIWPKTAPFIETYRLPTPLLIFQIALIAGSFITGFLLSPLLALSRHIAQRPVRRLRLPQEKQQHRRALAAGFYMGTITIVVGLIGSWTWWNLGRRNPWLWTILWLLEGRKKWSRPMLLAYWGLLGSISVAGWNRQLSRSRRYRHRNTSGGTQDNVIVPYAVNSNQKPQTEISSSAPTTALGLTFPNLANLSNLSNGSQVATELLDAADKHVPTLGINARRKFFHALAVVMFLPGVAVDPAFTHLSFSAAFALFIFAEYVRYFAIYPFGAAVHLFMNEFLEQKDSGTAILSHFYLLTGCAGPLWLEEPSQLLQYTGILALGIGDALASIIGKRVGRHRWSSTSSKTLEGSAAFVLSLVGCAWLLRLCGLTEEFSSSIITDTTLDPLPSPLPLTKPFSLPSAFQMPIPRLPKVKQRSPRLPRPATASMAEGTQSYLPPAPHAPCLHDSRIPRSLEPCDVDNTRGADSLSMKSFEVHPVDMVLAHSAPSGSPCETLAAAASTPCDTRPDIDGAEHDWATFMTAYALGQWHPHQTPRHPRSMMSTPIMREGPLRDNFALRHDAAPIIVESRQPSPPASPAYHTFISSSFSNGNSNEAEFMPAPEKAVMVPDFPSFIYPDKLLSKITTKPSSLSGRRFRKSFTDLRHATGGQPMHLPLDGAQTFSISPEATAAAATMRWAAARVNLSPLALPSPEHELTDPMRGVHAAIPGSHPTASSPPAHPTTPGMSRIRAGSFWEGTQDVEDESTVPALPGSLPRTPLRHINDGELYVSLPPPASVPLQRNYSPEPTEEGDYFTAVSTSASESFPMTPDPAQLWQDYVTHRRESGPMELNVCTAPPLPRRICLTRQTSSPLPDSNGRDRGLPGGRSVCDSVNSFRAGRSAKEEQMFLDLGYLAPPNPPDELERRRALYKFNLWNTGPDINFDRIAHLVKLVFNTKCVYISLIDGTEQWFKSQCGMTLKRSARLTSFCAHAILQRGDEPTVILDTKLDWRFAKNPLVTGFPNVRFYAAAPLRTSDGFNIGSLSLIDDSPRQDFAPRQRHTLKEFAAVVMREMELWRDKIQLRIRDKIQTSMEQFSRECLEIDQKDANMDDDPYANASMDRVYDRAARLVKRTLDVEEVVVMDVSHCEVLETLSAEATISVVMHRGDPQSRPTSRTLTADEYHKLNVFFDQYPDGKISEGILPVCFRPFIPTHIQYALTVPVFNIDKRPFALICAYNATDSSRRFLEGHELSYLRAIGVIILSAVLKRRMMLADQAKSLFISNISHELRTPLHGILAAAELLSDTSLSHSQTSFLHTVQACGTSLVETVNHVLDFTKLSGNMKSGGVDNVITRSIVDLEQLVEEAIDGSWIGYCARTSAIRESEIGSVYAPAMEQRSSSVLAAPASSKHVEIIVDIDRREGGWILKCDKGGIRRVLMNLFGNSLKFTTDGYVHVSLRQVSAPNEEPSMVELCVSDTGKGISQNFLKNHLFHPFSQENPLQAGTGLGLAIVNSIVQSPSVGGKVEVSSEENVGTDIKITFQAENLEDGASALQTPFMFDGVIPTVTFLGFKQKSKGVQMLSDVLRKYLQDWWGFRVQTDGGELSDIVIINEDSSPVVTALEKMDYRRSFIILSSSRGSPRVMGICSSYENLGGFCRIVHKPGGPFRLRAALKQLLRARQRRQQRLPSFASSMTGVSDDSISLHSSMLTDDLSSPDRHRRASIDWGSHSRSALAFPNSPPEMPASPDVEEASSSAENTESESTSSSMSNSTVTIGTDGILLESSIRTLDLNRPRPKVLVVEDNNILRNLLIKWLMKKGFEYREAVDGRQGVDTFESEGPFDVVLLDLSMPILDGLGATIEIRQLEKARESRQPSVILALTGMSSLEDKRRAFEAGMSGYLVKPVAFRTLEEMFRKIGLS